jgi:YD repeat-containing protein
MKTILAILCMTLPLQADTREVIRDPNGKVIATVDRSARRYGPAVTRSPQGKVIAIETRQGNTTVRRNAQGKVISTKTLTP